MELRGSSSIEVQPCVVMESVTVTEILSMAHSSQDQRTPHSAPLSLLLARNNTAPLEVCLLNPLAHNFEHVSNAVQALVAHQDARSSLELLRNCIVDLRVFVDVK